MVIYLLIGFVFLIYLVRKSNTDDLIKQANITTEQQKKELEEKTIKYKTTKFSCLLFATALISLVAIGAIRLTSIEVAFLDYFGTGINHKEIIIPLVWYITPFFILTIRGILIEVYVGDYVLRTYNLKEEEVDTKEALNAVKGLFYKKAPATTPTPVAENQNLGEQPTNETVPQQPTVVQPAIAPQPTVEQPAQTTPQPVVQPNVEPVVEEKTETTNETTTPVSEIKSVTETEQPKEEEKSNVNPFAV